MTSTNETRATTAAVTEGRPECALPAREQEQPQPEKKQRKGPAWIQTPVDDATFDLYQAHRKALGETWTTYILNALALQKETLEKRAGWREAKRRQKQNKKAASAEAAPVDEISR